MIVLRGFLGFALGYLAGHIVIVLPSFLPPPGIAYWQNEFSVRYPGKKWITFLYPIFFLGGFFGFPALMGQTIPYVHFDLELAFTFYFAFCVVGGVGIASGVFEVLTGVSPVPQGSRQIKNTILYFKAPWIHQYRYNHKLAWRTRAVGVVRISMGLSFLILLFLIGAYH